MAINLNLTSYKLLSLWYAWFHLVGVGIGFMVETNFCWHLFQLYDDLVDELMVLFYYGYN